MISLFSALLCHHLTTAQSHRWPYQNEMQIQMVALCLTILALTTCLPSLVSITAADKRVHTETFTCAGMYKGLSLGEMCVGATAVEICILTGKPGAIREHEGVRKNINSVCVEIQIYSQEMGRTLTFMLFSHQCLSAFSADRWAVLIHITGTRWRWYYGVMLLVPLHRKRKRLTHCLTLLKRGCVTDKKRTTQILVMYQLTKHNLKNISFALGRH